MMKEREIVLDLEGLLLLVWKKRKVFAKVMLVFAIVGLLLGLRFPKQYESQMRLLPEYMQGENMAQSLLQKYGGMLGINTPLSLDQNSSALHIMLYPQIAASIPVKLEVLSDTIYSRTYADSMTFEAYLGLKYPPGFVYNLKQGIKDLIGWEVKAKRTLQSAEGIHELTKAQIENLKKLEEQIEVKLDPELGILTIKTTMLDADIAAQVNQSVFDQMQTFVEDYYLEKERKKVTFITKEKEKAEKAYNQSQWRLAQYRDNNRNLYSSGSKVAEERLESDFRLNYSLFQGLSNQLEQAELQLLENKPVFKILEPNIIDHKAERKIPLWLMVFLFTLLGFFFTFPWFWIKATWNGLKSKVRADSAQELNKLANAA